MAILSYVEALGSSAVKCGHEIRRIVSISERCPFVGHCHDKYLLIIGIMQLYLHDSVMTVLPAFARTWHQKGMFWGI